MKYKLIKEYPGSSTLGTVSSEDYSRYPEFWKAQRLFVSKDAKDIYEGDHYYVVWINNSVEFELWKLNGPFIAEPLDTDEAWSDNAVLFADKIVAEKYIHEHKPTFSIRDIVDTSAHSFTVSHMVSTLLGVAHKKK